MGREGDMPAGIVAAFKRAGKDPMHFQYCSGY